MTASRASLLLATALVFVAPAGAADMQGAEAGGLPVAPALLEGLPVMSRARIARLVDGAGAPSWISIERRRAAPDLLDIDDLPRWRWVPLGLPGRHAVAGGALEWDLQRSGFLRLGYEAARGDASATTEREITLSWTSPAFAGWRVRASAVSLRGLQGADAQFGIAIRRRF